MKRLNNKILLIAGLCLMIPHLVDAEQRKARGGCYVPMCSPEQKRMDEILDKGRVYIDRLEAQGAVPRIDPSPPRRLATWSPPTEPNCNFAFHQRHFVACNLNDARARALSQHLAPRIDMNL